MKRLIPFLVRLYPPEWRERYGEELRALLEDSSPKPSTAFDLLKGALVMRFTSGAFPKQALILSVAGMLIGGAGSYLMPRMYQATAVMLMRPSTFSNYREAVQAMNHRNEILIQQQAAMVTSRQSLALAIMDPHLDLYRKERQSDPLEAVEDRMRSRITIQINTSPAKPGNMATVFLIRFTDPDRIKARDTVQWIVTQFINTNTHASSREYQSRFLELLDVPRTGEHPVSPNRAMIAAAGFVAGFFVAALMAIVRKLRGSGPDAAQLQSGV